MRQGDRAATNGASCGRRSRFVRTARPRASTPKTWKTSFARSIPITATSIVHLLGLESAQPSHAQRGAVHPIRWSKEFLEAGKKRLLGDTTREATAPEVKTLRDENGRLKQVLAETVLENRWLKKSVTGSDSEDDTCG